MSSLFDIEPTLHELDALAGLLGHVAASELEIEGSELGLVRRRLSVIYRLLAENWNAAVDERQAERTAWEAEREQLKAERAAPGSLADFQRAETLWRLLAASAAAVANACERRHGGA